MRESVFEEEYWKQNYSAPQTMDCIGNAKEHVRYLRSFLALEFIDVSTVIDLGFGLGFLFQRMLKEFLPHRAVGIEPSAFAFNKASKRKLRPVESMDLKLYNEDLMQWVQRKESKFLNFDLGICTSVFQYISEENLQMIIPVLSKRIKYLYLTVPTDLELKKQVEVLEFHDPYAIGRSREFYFKLMENEFTLVGNKVWESKSYFDEESTSFSDLLYRI